MFDLYEGNAPSPLSSPEYAEAVTPDDATDLPFPSKWIYATTPGIVTALMKQRDGTFAPVPFPIGDTAPLIIRTTRIMATGTTASGLVVCH